ncbi:MAG: 30S ribosomal protein S4 [Bacillota bacterium]
MARRTGPKHKLCRTVGVALCGSPKCPARKRPYAPGQHGPALRRKVSTYGMQLLEKRKLRHIYGIQERQFRRYYARASQMKGNTGSKLIELLETRLDNLTYRLGFSPTLDGARQLVNHGHVTVNGYRVDIPSFRVRPGDLIGLGEKARQMTAVKESLVGRSGLPPYLLFDEGAMTGTLIREPHRDEVPVEVNEGIIVEFYSR